MDVVYLYRSCDTIALRYSLRSLKNVPHDRVFLVGDKPDWIREIIHIPVKDLYKKGSYKYKLINTWNKIAMSCKCRQISDNFILFNDDYYVLEKIDSFPYYYTGKIKRYERPSNYQAAVMRSGQFFDSPLHFASHTPIVYNKERFLSLPYPFEKGLDHKIIYCNYYDVHPREKINDPKVRGASGVRLAGAFLSTSDKVERNKAFKKEMDKLFPEKSKYESDVF